MPAPDPLYHEALSHLQRLLAAAKDLDIREPSAATLATADRDGRPSARVVLVRGCDERGLVFYTNSRSRKGTQLAENPHAALCFYWDDLYEQARIEGAVEHATAEENDVYWRSRPRDNQLAAWASLQSQTLDDRAALEQRLAEVSKEYEGRDVPRPPHWFGYRVIPERIEFWRGLPARLHERTLYLRTSSGWTRQALYP